MAKFDTTAHFNSHSFTRWDALSFLGKKSYVKFMKNTNNLPL